MYIHGSDEASLELQGPPPPLQLLLLNRTTNYSTASLTNYSILSKTSPLTLFETSLSQMKRMEIHLRMYGKIYLIGSSVVLSKLKELSQLRFKLCPRFLKDHQFWTIYFALVKGFVAKYELHAIQLDKLKQMRLENENTPDVAACEVEMSEAKQTTDVSPTISEEHN